MSADVYKTILKKDVKGLKLILDMRNVCNQQYKETPNDKTVIGQKYFYDIVFTILSC